MSRSACISVTATTATSTSSSPSRCRCRSTSSTPWPPPPQRPLNFVSFTVPQGRNDSAYFEPLGGLRTGSDTELYFALVPYHPDDQPRARPPSRSSTSTPRWLQLPRRRPPLGDLHRMRDGPGRRRRRAPAARPPQPDPRRRQPELPSIQGWVCRLLPDRRAAQAIDEPLLLQVATDERHAHLEPLNRGPNRRPSSHAELALGCPRLSARVARSLSQSVDGVAPCYAGDRVPGACGGFTDSRA